VTENKHNFRAVIVCEDIRQEVNGKWSLMGVFSGDIVVQDFPAEIQLAFYIEYLPDSDEVGRMIKFDFKLLQDDTEMVKGHSESKIESGQTGTIILPRGIASFEKESRLRVFISVNEREEIEIVNKRILRSAIPSST
jgi:hypothetical protein